METDKRRNVLSIESAVMNGSVALIREESGAVIKREGPECSRAEKLLSTISSLLDEAVLTLRDIDFVAASRGPGSYSGIRIGLSTALGLANSVGVPCVGVSVLEAMACGSELKGSFIVAIPVGKNDVAWQVFDVDGVGNCIVERSSELVSAASFIDELSRFPNTMVFCQTDLITRIGDRMPPTTALMDAGLGMAEFVGRLALRRGDAGDSIEPIYLRNPDSNRTPRF